MKRYIRADGSLETDILEQLPLNPYDIGPLGPDEPDTEDNYDECITFHFEGVVVDIDKDGSWEYEDETYSWAASPDSKIGDWYGEKDNIYLEDITGVVEHIDELIEPYMPASRGRYKISGDVTLTYHISGVECYREYFEEHDGSYDYGEERYVDNAEVEYDYKDSTVDNFRFREIS